MSTDERLQEVIAEQALDWHMRHREGEMSTAARVAFVEWLRASPLNVHEYLEIARLTRALPQAVASIPADVELAVQASETLAQAGDDNVVRLGDFRLPVVRHEPARRSPARRPGAWVAVAATVLLSVSVYMWSSGYLGQLGLVPIISGSEQITVTLRDGSRMHMNANSRVHLHFTRGERLLDLETGQVLFDVAHDRSRPFRVRAGAADIVAVGTRFDVNRRAATLTVTVVEGKVDVVGQPPSAAPDAPRAAHAEPLRVAAGERVEVSADGHGLHAQAVDLRNATAWMRRDISFTAKPLAEVTEELNRYLEKPIIIQDDGLRGLRVSGIFNAYDSESFLAFLRQYDVEIDARDDVIYVRARAKPVPNRQVVAGK